MLNKRRGEISMMRGLKSGNSNCRQKIIMAVIEDTILIVKQK